MPVAFFSGHRRLKRERVLGQRGNIGAQWNDSAGKMLFIRAASVQWLVFWNWLHVSQILGTSCYLPTERRIPVPRRLGNVGEASIGI